MLKILFTEYTLEVFPSNSYDSHYSSSIMNLSRDLAEAYEDSFISTASDSSLTLSGQMPVVETTSIMSSVGLNVFQLRILLSIL